MLKPFEEIIEVVLEHEGGYVNDSKNFPFTGTDISLEVSKKYPYCVYRTVCLHKLEGIPKYYIGSTSIERIKNKYVGSVKSKAWKDIFNELKRDDAFRVDILLLYNSRDKALKSEKKLQELLDVVKSDLYFNMAVATVNGFFGRDVSGKNNPMYGVHLTPWNKGLSGYKIHTEESKLKTSKSLKRFFKKNPESRMKQSKLMLGKNKKIYTDGKNIWKGRDEIQKHFGFKSLFKVKKMISGDEIYVKNI